MMIRQALKIDVPKILEFERNYMVALEPESVERWDQSISYQRQAISENLSQTLVAEDEGILGHVSYRMLEDGMHITSIYVDETYRGQGLGESLLLACEEVLRHKYEKVLLETRTINPARFLFSKHQYIEIRRQDGWIYYEKDL